MRNVTFTLTTGREEVNAVVVHKPPHSKRYDGQPERIRSWSNRS